MENCIFCKIVAGEIPSQKVYEDENTMAFLDIAPVNYGHTLIIPKKHYKNLEEIDENTLVQVIKTVKKVGQAIKKGMDVKGYNVMENNDPVAGQVVPHIHFHIIPRLESDGLKSWENGKYGDGENEEVLKKIKNAF